MKSLFKYFIGFVITIAAFELLFWIHSCVQNNIPVDFTGVTTLTIWAAVLTVVFVVFSVIGLLNIDSRIKELNDIKTQVYDTDRQMKESLSDIKISANEERVKIVESAEEQIKKIVKRSVDFQTIHDLMTQILSIPNPAFRISHYTDLLHSDYDISEVNKCLILTRRGESYEMMGRIEEAAADYREAIRVAPNHPDGYIMMGLFNVNHKKNYAESITYFEKALEVDPKQSRMYGNIASSYAAMGDFEKAQEYLKKQRDYNVESAEYYYYKTIELKNSGQIDPDHSIEEGYLQRSLSIDPLFAPAIHALSNLYNQRTEYDQALNLLSEAIGKNFHPDYRGFIINRAKTNMLRKLPSLALPDLLWVYTMCPTDYCILFEIARCYSAMAKFIEASQFAAEALRIGNIYGDHRFDGALNKIIQLYEQAKKDIANLMNGNTGQQG